MYLKPTIKLLAILGVASVVSSCKSTSEPETSVEAKKIEVGRNLFFDTGLSNPVGQSCASCHAASTGFSDPNHAIVSAGAVSGLFGNRNAPSIGYTSFTPPLHYDTTDSTWVGGLFLDGRVNTLEEQAKKPFLSHLEMNNTSVAMLASKLRAAPYYPLFTEVFGPTASDDSVYEYVAQAIAAFERTSAFAQFTSKYDYYLKGMTTLSEQEMRGLRLFEDTAKGMCANCHITTPDATSGKVLFTDFTYDNIGVPKNPNNPYYTLSANENPSGNNYIDQGLGPIVGQSASDGQFKVPSLRNAAVSGPYFHNGYFSTLEEVVHWYNVRDSATAAGGFPPPEIEGNVNHEELGHLHLTPQEEADIVAFIKTLTDGYK